jgi:hypothetical protein
MIFVAGPRLTVSISIEKTRRISNQKGGVHSAQPTYQHEKWMKGKKEIIFIPDFPGFVLQLASRFDINCCR